jgi:hypothetical protein
MCQGFLAEADTDADGFCDRVENDAGCSITDAREIPPALESPSPGRPGLGPGEALTTWAAPGLERVPRTTDPSCPGERRLRHGRLLHRGEDLGPVPRRYGLRPAAEHLPPGRELRRRPDMTFGFVKTTRTASATAATPVTPGCSRKIDFTLDPARPTNRFKIKTTGVIGGRTTRDADRFRIGNY